MASGSPPSHRRRGRLSAPGNCRARRGISRGTTAHRNNTSSRRDPCGEELRDRPSSRRRDRWAPADYDALPSSRSGAPRFLSRRLAARGLPTRGLAGGRPLAGGRALRVRPSGPEPCSSRLPRPEPLFLPPWSVAFTVAHARRSAVVRPTAPSSRIPLRCALLFASACRYTPTCRPLAFEPPGANGRQLVCPPALPAPSHPAHRR